MQISSVTTSLDSMTLANKNTAVVPDKATVVKSFSDNLPLNATKSSLTNPQLATNLSTQRDDTAADSVRVSSSIGKAASSGQLTREEALAIYQKIAKLL